MRTWFVSPVTSRESRVGAIGAALRADALATLPAWLAARVIVAAALELARFLSTHLQVVDPAIRQRAQEGLLSWDASWYRDIAIHGYRALPKDALRFFPLLPFVTRAARFAFGGDTGITLLVVANAAAFVLGMLIHRLALMETGDEALARRATWLLALAPPAFVLVMGYSEGLFMAFAVAMFIALRSKHWLWACALGILAGMTRPLGILLVVPAVVEAARGIRQVSGKGLAARALAVSGPVLGTGAFLLWAQVAYGDGLLPVRIQQQVRLRGPLLDPFRAVLHESRGIVHGHHIGSGLHVPWVVGLTLLAIVCLRRWPASYGLFAVPMLIAAASSANLDSFERYGLSAFPLVLAGASLTASGRVERAVLAVSAAAMGGYAVLAFLNASVP
jgi:hypothetical protein